MAYLDHAATTPMFEESVRAMSEALAVAGNASSLHASGRRARRTVEECRESIAAAIGAHPSEVIFTAGGTESDNLAVKGMYWARGGRRRILVSSVEHHAVLDTAQWLADQQGAELVPVAVDALGRVNPEALRAAIEPDPDAVALVSVMLANNEVGTVNPVRALAEVAAEYGIPLHTDAVQAAGMLPLDFAALGVSAMTLTGHKLGGPQSAGLLVLRREVACTPVLHGGGQQREVRSGTLDLPAIVGLASAIELATQRRAETAKTVAALRDSLIDAVRAAVPDVILNGAVSPEIALPGIANVTFPGCSGEALLMLLDAAGIECSMGSACTAGVAAPSHVLLGMGRGAAAARSSLRFSLGHTSTAADVSALAEQIGQLVATARGSVKSLRSKEKA